MVIFLCVPDLEEITSNPNLREKSSLNVTGNLKLKL